MPGLDDYGALIRSGMAAVPDYAQQQAEQQMIAVRRMQAQAQLAEVRQKLEQRQAFGEDVTAVLADPNPKNVSALILKHPEYAEQVKSGWDLRDKATKQADLTQLGGIYSAAQAGKWDVAAKAARARFDADKAAGQIDPTEEQIVSALESGDPAERNAALGMIGVQLAAATGAEHFGTVYGNLQGDYTLDQGAARFNRSGSMIAHSPFIKDADGNIRLWNDTPGGGTDSSQPMDEGRPAQIASSFGNLPGPVGEVASTLAAGNLPAPVVAGFLGNFHAEGGYAGAKGDGGTANGIGQWRAERAANFERVVGKPVSEASAKEQAGFVLWELQNPEAAGMTLGQRDAILAAKTAPQAAALIDQFYERSSGQHRSKRMAAAAGFEKGIAPAAAQNAAAGGGQFPIVIPGKPKEAPSGYRWSADGSKLEKIEGGPADNAGDQYRIMTPQENETAGLDPNVRYQKNLKTGQVTALGGQDKSQGQLKPVPPQARNLIVSRRDALRQIDTALKALETNPGAIGYVKGNLPESVVQRIDPKGVTTRAAIGKVSGQIIHDVSGAAVTMSEAPRFRPYIPALSDTPAAAKDKLRQLRALVAAEIGDLSDTYGPENGYRGVNLAPVGGGPVKVRSVQEAKKLKPGTLFVTPDGRTMRKR